MKCLSRYFLLGLALSAHPGLFASAADYKEYNPPCSITVNAGPDKTMCDGSSAVLGVTAGGTGPYTYSWTPSGSLSNSASSSPVAYPASTTTYSVTVTDANGCTGTDAITITVVPSGELVPNGDFESSVNPLLRGQIENSTLWKKATGDADLFDRSFIYCQPISVSFLPTIDLCGLSPLDYNCIGIPCNHFGYQETNKPGTHFYAGLWAGVGQISLKTANPGSYQQVDVAVEGIEIPLSVALVPGTTYRVTFYAVRAEKGEADSLATAPYAMYQVKLANTFSDNTLFQPVNATVIGSGTISDTTNWQKISFVFTAATAATHLIIESAIDPLLYAYSDLGDPVFNSGGGITTNGLQAYFFVDDVSLKYECESHTILVADAGPDKNICKGSSVTIGGSPAAAAGTPSYTYFWSPPGSLNDPFIANPVANPLVSTTYTLKVTDSNGLVNTDMMTVNVSDMDFDAGPPSYTICSGTVTTIGGIPTGGIPPYSYSWTPSAGLSSTAVAQPQASPSSNTKYFVTVTDAAGCTRTDSVQFTVIQSPVATASNNVTICAGNSTVLAGSGSGGLAPYILRWIDGSAYSFGSSVSVSPSSTTAYVLEVEDARGCIGRDTVMVTVNPRPQMNLSSQVRCPNGPAVVIGGPASGGLAPYAYSWSHGLSGAAQHTVSPASTTTYSVTITDSRGCTGGGNVTVTVHPMPAANAGRDKTICTGGSTIIGGLHTGSGEGGFTYSWTPILGLNNPSLAMPTASPSVTTNYIVTVTNSNGCQAKDTMRLTVLNTCAGGGEVTTPGCGVHPEADAGPDLVVCRGASPTIGGSPTATFGKPPYTYLWTPSTGLSSATVANPTVSNISRQTYKLFVTDSCGRVAQDIVTVTMRSADANAGPDKTICSGGSTLIGVEAAGGTPPYSYTWTASPGPSPGSGAPKSVSPLTTTTYVLTLNDGLNCISKDSVVVNVLPGISFNLGPDISICTGTGGATTGSNATGGTPGFTYSWYPARGLSSTTSAIVNANPFLTTDYIVRVSDANNCQAVDDITVFVNESPYVNAGSDKTFCRGESDSIGNPAQLGTPPYTYSWSPATGLSSATVARPEASPLTTTTYVVTATDALGCTAKDTVVVTIKSTPTANAGQDKAICSGKCTTIGIVATGGIAPLTYAWDPAWNLSSATAATPTACPAVTTTYTVTVTGANQCSHTDVVEVQVYQTPEYVPNGNFETGGMPLLRGELEKADPWKIATGDPDLFDVNNTLCASLLPPTLPAICGLSPLDYHCVGIPCNHFGDQNHRDPFGFRYAGLWSALTVKLNGDYTPDSVNYATVERALAVEGMEVKLIQPLTANREYRISFWVNRAEKGETGGNLPPTIPQLGTDSFLVAPFAPVAVKFSMDLAKEDLFAPVSRPVYFTGVVSDDANWVYMTGTFKPADNYEYLIIESDPIAYRSYAVTGHHDQLVAGDHMGDSLMATQPNFGLQLMIDTAQPLKRIYHLQTYMYIDDISIVETCDSIPPLVISAGGDTTVCTGTVLTLGGSPTAAYGTPTYTYAWSTVPPSAFSSALPNPVITATSNTTYALQVSDAGVQVKYDTITVTVYTQQQYVSNPDFEQGTLPLVRGDIERAPAWFKGTGDADLYDTAFSCAPVPCGLTPADFNCVDIPCNHFGYQNIRNTGQRHAGLWSLIQLSSKSDVVIETLPSTVGRKTIEVPTITETTQIAVEAIEIDLGQVLDTNRYYQLDFYISKAERGETGDNISQLPAIPGTNIDTKGLLVDECAGYHVKMSKDVATNILYQPIPRPVISSGEVCDTVNWELESFTFRPTEEFRYLIIESYPTDGAYARLDTRSVSTGSDITDPETPYASGFQSYFYIDDVTLVDLCDNASPGPAISRPQVVRTETATPRKGEGSALSVREQHTEAFSMQVAPNPNNGAFSLHYSLGASGYQNPEIVIYDAIGKVLKRIRPQYTDNGKQTLEIDFKGVTGEVIGGMYFVRLVNGNESIVKKISVIP